MSQFDSLLEEKDITTAIEVEKSVPALIFTEWSTYFAILFQLVNNAIKFNERKGKVSIKVLYDQLDWSSR